MSEQIVTEENVQANDEEDMRVIDEEEPSLELNTLEEE